MAVHGRDHVVEDLHDDDEQHRRKWVTPPKAARVADLSPWPPVHQDPRSGGREKYGDPFGPSCRKANECEELYLYEELPRGRVERLGDVNLQEDSWAVATI